MAAATQTPTKGSDVNKVWRKIQGDIVQGMNFEVEEFEQVGEITVPENIPYSAREVTMPVDIVEGAGAAQISEGGKLARPSTPNMQEITISMLQTDGRFNATGLSEFGDDGNTNQLERQLLFQGSDKLRTIARHFGDYFYGVSTAYLAQVNAALTGTTLTHTLTAGYGQAGITTAAFLADKFRAGDYVGLVRSAALVANAIGLVGNVDVTNGALTITWAGTVTAASADYVVKANSMENTTLADGTDYNKGFVGLIDMLTASSVHGLANTVARWNPSYSDTAAGRFSGSKLHRANDEIKNYGASKGVNLVFIDQGVNRDLINLRSAGVRFDDPMNMEIDGSIKSKGRTFFSSRRVPPGYVIPVDKSAIALWSLTPKPDGRYAWKDGKELIDDDLMVFDMRWPVALVCRSRAKLSYFTSQTRA